LEIASNSLHVKEIHRPIEQDHPHSIPNSIIVAIILS
jgi:hypothetical protein